MYKLKNDRDAATLRQKDTAWDYDGGDGTTRSSDGFLRQTKDNASAIHVLGKVLYSVVQQEWHGKANEDDHQERENIDKHDGTESGADNDMPLATSHTKRDLEGNITYLLQQLSHNPSLHDAIASQALPLLLRVATTPMASSLVISHKQMSALSVLNDLASTAHVGKNIISMAHDDRLLVPLLKNLSRIEHWRVRQRSRHKARNNTNSTKTNTERNQRMRASTDLLFAGLFQSLENYMQRDRRDALKILPTEYNLSTVPFVPSPVFSLRARSQVEVEALVDISKGMPSRPDDVPHHNVQTLRQFAMRIIEATVHANEEASTFSLLSSSSSSKHVGHGPQKTLSDIRRRLGSSRPVNVDWDRMLANAPGGDPSDVMVLLSLMRADAAAIESAQCFTACTGRKGRQEKSRSMPREEQHHKRLSLGHVVPWNKGESLARTLVSNWITPRGRETGLSEAPITSVSSSAIQLLSLQVLALLTSCGSDEAQHVVPLLSELRAFGLAQRARLDQLSFMPPATDPTSRQRIALEQFVLEQGEWLLSEILSNCGKSTATLDVFSTSSSSPDGHGASASSQSWLELTLSWLQVDDCRVRNNARSLLSGHVTAQRPNGSDILKAWMSTALDSMSLLLPVITEQRTKVELQVGQSASTASKVIETDANAAGASASPAGSTLVQNSQTFTPGMTMAPNDKHNSSAGKSPSVSLTHWLSHASKAFAIAFDAAEDFGGKWEEDPSVASAVRENNLELLRSAEISGVLDALRAAVEASGGLKNCNVHVAKNVARAVANITSCDLALALARREVNAGTGVTSDMSDTSSVEAEYTSLPVFGKHIEAELSAWLSLLSSWAAETDEKRDLNDLKLMHHAKRALSHLQGYQSFARHRPEDKRHPARASRSADCPANFPAIHVYADGCFPVHTPFAAFDNNEITTNCADIVFLHGLGGGAFETWHQDILNDKFDISQFWPALWVPSDFERRTGGMQARVISMAYEATPLLVGAETSHLLLSLSDTASQMRKKLELAGVGRQGGPVVFITHSLGGLVAKNMLLQALCDVDAGGAHYSTKNMRAIAEETRAVVFYSVPHKGSPMMDFLQSYKDGLVGVGLARDHPVLPFLNTGYGPGLALNEKFGRLFGDRCLSIGEGAPETLVGLLDMDIAGRELLELFNLEAKGMIQVVERDSSDPGFGSYEQIQGIPHSMINKPANMGTDRRYLAMMEFVADRCIVEQQQQQRGDPGTG
jgi:hypothetical protein